MKRIFADCAIAALLTFPVYLGLANNSTINDWFLYGSAWETFQPLFDLGHAIGIDRHAAIVIGTMFTISYALSLGGIVIARAAVRGLFARARAHGQTSAPDDGSRYASDYSPGRRHPTREKARP
jgi:hypothetical protein